ncbi:MAG: type I-E CRISPR-associated endonuclease Cas1e [Bacillota bacterium]
MPVRDLHELPKFRDGWSYLYVEHCTVDQEAKAIAIHDKEGRVPVPCASLALLMLGPGTKITHAAIRALADNGCLVVWCGEQGIRFYAQGMGECRTSERLLRQAKLCSDPELRLRVVLRLYEIRFGEPIPPGTPLNEVRGREGARVREAYARASRETGIPWRGRSYDRSNWAAGDKVNRALSAANACLYGICHAAIVSLGCSLGLGFIHTGRQLSFVYDIADLYKTETTIPIAFRVAAKSEGNIEREARLACRDLFAEKKLLARIVEDIDRVLGIEGVEVPGLEAPVEDDTAPGGIWDPQLGTVSGGVNYDPEAEEAEEEEAAADDGIDS